MKFICLLHSFGVFILIFIICHATKKYTKTNTIYRKSKTIESRETNVMQIIFDTRKIIFLLSMCA